jgi:hypothetical protein
MTNSLFLEVSFEVIQTLVVMFYLPDHRDSSPTSGGLFMPVVHVLGKNYRNNKVTETEDLTISPFCLPGSWGGDRSNSVQGLKVPWFTYAMPIAPMVRIGFRPVRSIHSTAGMVNINMTIPTTPVARREVVFEVRPSWLKMVGA